MVRHLARAGQPTRLNSFLQRHLGDEASFLHFLFQGVSVRTLELRLVLLAISSNQSGDCCSSTMLCLFETPSASFLQTRFSRDALCSSTSASFA